jgi:hypothetical protein
MYVNAIGFRGIEGGHACASQDGDYLGQVRGTTAA